MIKSSTGKSVLHVPMEMKSCLFLLLMEGTL